MPRTHVKDASVVLTLPINGIMTNLSIPGRIFSMTKSDRNNGKTLHQFCPECESPIGHQLFCKEDENHGPFQRDEVLRGKYDEDKKIVIVDSESVEEATESSIAKGKLTLSIVDRQSLLDGTCPQGNTYHFMPLPADDMDKEAYQILYSAISDNPDWAFVCRANIGRGAETLISLEAGAFGGLTIQNLAYPESLYDLPDYEVPKVPRSVKADIRALLEDAVTKFDPEDWNDRQAEAVSDALTVASGKKRRGKVLAVKSKKTEKPSLFGAIQASAKQKVSA